MKYGCRICRKRVTPKNGRLICCGHNEPVPAPPTRRLRCEDCRGVLDYRAADEFLGIRRCFCSETDINWDLDEYSERF